MQHLPLLFSCQETVYGEGFQALVTMKQGRALFEVESDTGEDREIQRCPCDLYGVNPGGLAASGETMPEAWHRFRQGIKEVLFDLASEATDIEDFRARVSDFWKVGDTHAANDWEAARRRLAQLGKAEGVDLPLKPDPDPPSLEILDARDPSKRLGPDSNRADEYQVAA